MLPPKGRHWTFIQEKIDKLKIDRIMLDNMTIEEIKELIRLTEHSRVERV